MSNSVTREINNMDALTHTLLATACLALAFYAGVYLSRREAMRKIPDFVLRELERDGFLCIEIDSDGDECLVSVETLRKKAREEVQ